MDTLIVRHLPGELSSEEQEDLLKHFGAKYVRCMGNKGRLKYVAFATFANHTEASKALHLLHQLEVFGHRLVVQFSTKNNENHHPMVSNDIKSIQTEEKKEQVVEKAREDISETKKITDDLNKISSKWGLDYPYNPRLQYLYPPPTVTILTNIMNTLAAVPKLYVQVLHLMNKMNLPAPFGEPGPCPPIDDDRPITEDMFSSEESEIESEGELKDLTKQGKRSLPLKKVQSKRRKIRHLLPPVPSLPKSRKLIDKSDVFEQPEPPKPKKVTVPRTVVAHPPLVSNKLTSSKVNEPVLEKVGENVPLRGEESVQPDVSQHPTPVQESGGGFGKLEPVAVSVAPADDEAEEEEEWGAGEFISSRRLRKGRLSTAEMRHLNVYKGYHEGEPTARLYVKNVAKSVTDKDLHYVFGRYVDWEKDEEKVMFDIRLMQEGRMKGQAFITLPSERDAKAALRDTNGFALKDKPLVVQFARSAKPKEVAKVDASGS